MSSNIEMPFLCFCSKDLNECIEFMTAVVKYLSGKETQSGEDADTFKEAESMLQELKELSDKLDTRLVIDQLLPSFSA